MAVQIQIANSPENPWRNPCERGRKLGSTTAAEAIASTSILALFQFPQGMSPWISVSACGMNAQLRCP
jgi:hypothetical protein